MVNNVLNPYQAMTKKSHCSETGSVMIEGAISFGLLFFFVFSALQLLWLGYNAVISQYLVSDSIRTINQTAARMTLQPGLNSQVKSGILNRAKVFRLIPQTVNNYNNFCTTRVQVDGTTTGCQFGTVNFGSDRDLISLQMRHSVSLLFGTVNYQLTSVAVGRNEPV